MRIFLPGYNVWAYYSNQEDWRWGGKKKYEYGFTAEISNKLHNQMTIASTDIDGFVATK